MDLLLYARPTAPPGICAFEAARPESEGRAAHRRGDQAAGAPGLFMGPGQRPETALTPLLPPAENSTGSAQKRRSSPLARDRREGRSAKRIRQSFLYKEGPRRNDPAQRVRPAWIRMPCASKKRRGPWD